MSRATRTDGTRWAADLGRVEQLIPFARRAPLPFVQPSRRPSEASTLPDSLWTIATHLSTRALHPDAPTFASSSSALVRGGLFGLLRPRLLAAKLAHPPFTNRDDALGLVYRLSVVIGESMRPLATPLGGLVNGARSVFAGLRTLRRVSLQPLEASRIALEGGASGVCRDFATTLQTLFWLVQAETGVFPNARLVSATGRSMFSTDWSHAWTWLFERDRRQVVALDLTQATLSWREGGAQRLLSPSLGATSHNNSSSLLAMLFLWIDAPTGRSDFARAALSFCRELASPRDAVGAELLFRLLQQRYLSPTAYRLGREALAASPLELERADGAAVLDANETSVHRFFRSAQSERQSALMQALLQ